MPNIGKTKLKAISGQNMQNVQELTELRERIRIHRIKRLIAGLAIISAFLIIINIVNLYFQRMTYYNYEVIEKMERVDTEACEFESFCGNMLKYTKDGAVYSDMNGNMIWNQTYEMETPRITMCENYLSIYEQGGTKIYILDTTGLQGIIQTTVPLQRVSIANQGTVAVLTENGGTSYVNIYSKSGKELAAGEFHIEDGGFPMDIALSNDAQKLAVSRMDINEGNVKTTVVFYNYGSIGQNEIDNIVGVYSYSDTVIPRLQFVSNELLIAFSDNEVILYEGGQKPSVANEVDYNQKIVSVFLNEKYFGLVFNGQDAESYQLIVYNMRGNKIMEQEFKQEYNEIQFLSNDMICIHGTKQCTMYTIKGDKKFEYTFDKELYEILSGNRNEYLFIMNGETDRVKLIK